MPAKYVLAHKGTGYHWNLLATNGRVIATSETYNSKAAAMAGIRSVQKNGSTDVVITDDELKASRSAARPAKKASAGKATPKAASADAKPAPKKSAGKKATAKATGTARKTAKG